MRHEKLFELLATQLSAERICNAGQVIHQFDQWSSFDGYKRTADFLIEQFQQAGAEAVERIAIPCDGEFAFGDWVMPMAWDAKEGTLELLDGDGRRELLLADYRAVPNNLVRWSGPTTEDGEVLELLYLPDAAADEHWKSADVRGKLIFTHTRIRATYPFAAKYGAAGVVTDFSSHPDACPDLVQWGNVWGSLPLWGPVKDDKPVPGFILSPNVGKELARRLGAARQPLKVRARIRSRLYEGETDVVTATISGSEYPDQEVVCYAHSCECQLDDNALATAAVVEIVRTCRELIEAGALPRPRRTIRFVVGWEWVGSTYYAMHHRGGRKWLASLCLDAICTRQDLTHAPVVIAPSPTFAASFADAMFVDLWKTYAREHLSDRAWRTTAWSAGTDTYWIDPHMGGVSNVLAEQGMGPTWHKSHTNVEQIDRELLRAVGVVSAAWLTRIASAGAADARHFSRIAADRIERRVRRYATEFDFGRTDVQSARQQFQHEMGYLGEASRRTIDTTVLAPDDDAVRARAEGLVRRVERAIEEETSAAERRFDQTAAALPDWLAARPDDYVRDRDERVADNMIPTRLVEGYLWTLHRMPADERRRFWSYGRLEPLVLFGADGKRTLLELVRRCEFEQGRALKLRDLIRQFRMLGEAGYVRLDYKRTFDTSQLLEDLRRLDVRAGDTILVHPSLHSLGPLANGPETILTALEQAVGKEGTVCVPAFAWNSTERQPEPFDVKTTPCRAGRLCDLFWRRPGVLRGEHPGHGLAAWGRHAERIVRDDRPYDAFDVRRAFGTLYQLDAKIVIFGCGLSPNSTIHAAEDWANLPSAQPCTYHYLDETGQRQEITYLKVPLHWRDFYNLSVSTCERLFRQKGLITEGALGLARAFVMPLRGVIDYSLELIRSGQFEFLFGDGAHDPAVRDIMDKVRTQWSFPEEILRQLQAFKGTSPS